MVHSIGVLYLYRCAEGEAPVRRFLSTLRRHPAGHKYDLYVVFKGFPDQASLQRARTLFEGMEIIPVEVADQGYDIGSYVAATRFASNRYLIFLNTFSEILSDNWLLCFFNAIKRPGVGIVGATGSWQARTTGYEVQARLILRRIHQLSDEIIGRSKGTEKRVAPRRPKTLLEFVRFAFVPFAYFHHLIRYPRYPNPHIRTNAFMIERDIFLSLQFPSFKNKEDAYRFESGRRSMTRQIMRKGLAPVVVDRNGAVYDVSKWNVSLTFWQSQQENLVIADNRTQDYMNGSTEFRLMLENSAWRHPRSWWGA